MKKIGIVVAMQKESDAMFGQYGLVGCRYISGKTDGDVEFVSLVSGIGKVNAAVTAYKLWKEYDVTEILSFGCAGGMTNEVEVGDVVIGDGYVYHDVWCGKPNERGQVQDEPLVYPSNCRQWEWLADNQKVGLIATGDALVENEIMAGAVVMALERNPLAVDMESAAIAQVCHKNGICFTSIRVISDNPLIGRHVDEYKDFWDGKDKTLAGIVRRFMTYKS